MSRHLHRNVPALLAAGLVALVAAPWPLLAADAPTEEQVGQAVQQTRELLDGGLIRPTRPWYDSETDGVRRLDLRLEREEPSWDLSWLAGTLKFLSTAGGWLGLALFFLLVALTIWRVVVWRMRRQGEDSSLALALDDRRSDLDRVESLPFQVARQQTDLLNEARRQYAQGNYSEAIVYLFSHQLVELDKQHIIRLVRGKTNRQLVREVGPRRELRLLVEQTMVAFEDVFFGNHVLSRARFESCWLELDRFARLVQEAAP